MELQKLLSAQICKKPACKLSLALFAFGALPFGSPRFRSGLRHRRRIARRKAILEFPIEFCIKLLSFPYFDFCDSFPWGFRRFRLMYARSWFHSFAASERRGTIAIGNCSLAGLDREIGALPRLRHSARTRAGGKTTSTKVPLVCLLLIVSDA
jgi:hypothetical protein